MTTPPPCCCSFHSIYGIFLGGRDLNDDYTPKFRTLYKFTTQLHINEQYNTFKGRITTRRNDTASIESKGTLKIHALTANTIFTVKLSMILFASLTF